MLIIRFLALTVVLGPASAAFLGFTYLHNFNDGRFKTQADFEAEFQAAANIAGTKGIFTSARLYTMIQAGTTSEPTSAIPAAIATNTTLLLGLWASDGEVAFDAEIQALRSAIQVYGQSLAKLVTGIAIGSEDLSRFSVIDSGNARGLGIEPSTLIYYIEKVRSMIAGTPLASTPLGHVDHWTAFVNSTNGPVISALDWLGMNAFPFFQNDRHNDISAGKDLFTEALGATRAVAQGKPIWITETGWPVSGQKQGQAVPSPMNAKKYWNDVGCPMIGKANLWWYTLRDASPSEPDPSFGVVEPTLSKSIFDLSCPVLSGSDFASQTTISLVKMTDAGSAATTTTSTSMTPMTPMGDAAALAIADL